MNDIRSLRYAKRLTQRALAAESGVELHALRRWERGLERPPREGLRKLARVLGVDASALSTAQRVLTQRATTGEGYTTALPDSTLILERRKPPVAGLAHVLDLFCGAGGFSYGFERQGDFQATCGIDLLPDRVKTFHANHRHARAIAHDICDYPLANLEEDALQPDVILGGPPCQGFSSLRPFRTLTEGDRRNSLPEQYLLTIGILRPRWFVFENVVGLLSHRKGNILRELVSGLKKLGYTVDWRVINAANFGVPQNRERVFVVGNRAGKQLDWPSPTHVAKGRSMAGRDAPMLAPTPLFDGPLADPTTVIDAIGDLPPVDAGKGVTRYLNGSPANWFAKKMRGRTKVLTLHEATGHSEEMLRIVRLAGKNRSALPPGSTSSGFSSCYSRLDADEPSTTITVNFVHPSSNRCIHPFQHRALTPREGARLQSFPDSYRFVGSRAQIVKQIGNAVPPMLASALAEAIAAKI